MESGFALIATTHLNAAGAKKPNGGSFTQADFMPFVIDRDDEREATPEDMKRMFGIDADG